MRAICSGVCNFALVENFGNQQTLSLVLSQNFLQIQKPHRHYFDCRGFATNLKNFVIARKSIGFSWQSKQNTIRTKCESLQKFLLLLAFAKSRIPLYFVIARANRRFAEAIHENNKVDCHDFATQNLAMTGKGESSLRGRIVDSHEAIQKNNPCDSAPNLARYVVQKIGIKGRSSASADFLLEKDLLDSPPKSEKSVAFWGYNLNIWGERRREVQPFLQKEKYDRDSINANIDCFGDESPCNDGMCVDLQVWVNASHGRFGDKSPRNDESPTTLSLRGRIVDSHEAIQKTNIDYHEFAFANYRNDGTIAFESPRNATNSPQRLNFAF